LLLYYYLIASGKMVKRKGVVVGRIETL